MTKSAVLKPNVLRPHPLNLGEIRAPRYTSYPTAPMFSPLEADSHELWLEAVPAETPLSLYVHVPFCRDLCWFCGCNTTITSRQEPIARYLDTLGREIDLTAEALGPGRPVRHLHFGGGSPTILKARDFKSLVSYLRALFGFRSDAEIAVEMDPRTLDAAKIAAYAEAGVNRASLGVQDFNPGVQKAVHRIQPRELVEQVVGALRASGIENINMDLMCGLPGQTIESFLQTVEQAIALSPDRVAMFSYAHVPWMKKHQQMIDVDAIPAAEERMAMLDYAHLAFRRAGYMAIGMDHYAKWTDSLARASLDGTLHRNFQGYTTDEAEALVAFGPSSISKLPKGYVQAETNLKAWHEAIAEGRLPTAKGHRLSDDDRMYGEAIERLMCDYEIDIAEVAGRHGAGMASFSEVLSALRELEEEGLVTLEGPHVRVTREYPMAVRLAAACFDQYIKDREALYSKVV